MTVKFNQYWRIDSEKVPEYEKFVMSKFITQKVGGYKSQSYQFVAG